jgi:pyruvate/2-oxoacid:ferredoxin oxidoreductase alpha subunit
MGAPVVFETVGGTAGSILIAAPGYHAAEAVRAARMLGREKFSVTVISLRYLRPSRTVEILKAAENFDLVLFSDSGGGSAALFSSDVLRLIAAGREAVTISGPPGNARTIADNAISALREQRFRRTLDDVREDRWR